MTFRSRAAALLAIVALAVAGCDSSPAPLSDGEYRVYAGAPELGQKPAAGLVIDGDGLSLTESDRTTSLRLGAEGGEYVLCPPGGQGAPLLVDAPLSVDGIAFSKPAIFGDCGQTRPKRVTLVDLSAATSTAGPFPFTRWIEFCDTTDPDCP